MRDIENHKCPQDYLIDIEANDVKLPIEIQNTNLLLLPVVRKPTLVRPQASWILKGHRSIPNSIAYHPDLQLLASSGVEKTVKVCISIWNKGHEVVFLKKIKLKIAYVFDVKTKQKKKQKKLFL